MPKGEVELAPFGRLRTADRAALEADAADVARFLDAAPEAEERSRTGRPVTPRS